MRVLLLFFLLLLTACTPEVPVTDQERLASLTPYLSPIRSIDPTDDDFSDLQPVKDILKDKSIVLLGEQSHGDGATFQAKIRLIRFLHREMGFSALVMESGLADCELAERAMNGGIPAWDAMSHSVFDIWTGSRQVQPLFALIDSARQAGNPIRLAGMDLQITGSFGRDSLNLVLNRYFRSQSLPDTLTRPVLSVVDSMLIHKRPAKKVSDQAADRFQVSAQHVLTLTAADSLRWERQVLKSFLTFFRFSRLADFNKPDPAIFNLRDQQMADNLNWLIKSGLKGRKIMVWAASSHLSRNRHLLMGRQDPDTAMIPMGHLLWQMHGEKVYCLGFSAGDGKVAIRDRIFWDLAFPQPGSLESVLMASPGRHLWLDFSSLPDGHWLHQPLRARPYGYSVMTGKWTGMMDGLFFIRTMTPSTGIH
ncbi:MAG: erythromycin esterase family protein [Bacteroidetes bacterium]|nr:erythromycin esterase family protein [Bacteroidota bacterium]